MVKKCELLIQNAAVMTDYQTIRKGMDVAVGDGKILAVFPHGEEEWEGKETLSGKDRVFMPGLIDSHMHTGQQLLKGLVLDARPIIWTRVMLPFESTLTPERMKLSAELAALEMIRCGTTGFVESGSYFMEEAAAVYLESGLRGRLSCSTMDEDGLPESIAMDAKEAVRRADRLYEDWNGAGNLKVYYSLRALNSCSDQLVRLTAEHAEERGAILHIRGKWTGSCAGKGCVPMNIWKRWECCPAGSWEPTASSCPTGKKSWCGTEESWSATVRSATAAKRCRRRQSSWKWGSFPASAQTERPMPGWICGTR